MPAKIINERPVCGDCKFWDMVSEADGTCHAGPPTSSNNWPFTRYSDWCGAWKVKPVQAKAPAE